MAIATAASRVQTRGGCIRATRQPLTLAVKPGASCRILDLSLQKLRLTLLGLTVDTSALNLHVTGQRTASLGKLFCALAQSLKLGNVAKQASVARLMNRRLRGRPMHVVSFRAALPKASAVQAAGTTNRSVLPLTPGPLNLNLLGLVVDLHGATPKDPVIVTITADPNGGALGALFCKLAQTTTA